MKTSNVLVQYDKDLRLRAAYPEARSEITRNVVRIIRRAPGMNAVAFTFASEGRLHTAIHRELDFFAPLNQPFTWKVYEHDRLPELPAALREHGFAEDEQPADVMLLDLRSAPAHLLEPVQADIRRITTVEGLEDIIRVLNGVYGNDNAWVRERLGLHLQVPRYLSAYVAYVDDQPAAVAWTYFPRGHFATLFAGSTLATFRKRGLYTALLATRLQEIRRRGYPFAVVEAGSMSRPIVARNGFQHLTTVWDYEWQGTLPEAAACEPPAEVVLAV